VNTLLCAKSGSCRSKRQSTRHEAMRLRADHFCIPSERTSQEVRARQIATKVQLSYEFTSMDSEVKSPLGNTTVNK
jgi:hypothetical protein